MSCFSFNCGHDVVESFGLMIRVDDGIPFGALRFKCSKCGNLDVQQMPDWLEAIGLRIGNVGPPTPKE